MTLHLRATSGRVTFHMGSRYLLPDTSYSYSYRVTLFNKNVLRGGTSERPRLTPAMQAGTRFTYLGGMEG